MPSSNSKLSIKMYLSAGITLLLVASLSGTLALSENAEHQLAHVSVGFSVIAFQSLIVLVESRPSSV